jgi:hypothetical protein
MIGVFKGDEHIGSLLKIMAASRPWYAYVITDGSGQNFKTRKEAIAWLETRHYREALRPFIRTLNWKWVTCWTCLGRKCPLCNYTGLMPVKCS